MVISALSLLSPPPYILIHRIGRFIPTFNEITNFLMVVHCLSGCTDFFYICFSNQCSIYWHLFQNVWSFTDHYISSFFSWLPWCLSYWNHSHNHRIYEHRQGQGIKEFPVTLLSWGAGVGVSSFHDSSQVLQVNFSSYGKSSYLLSELTFGA